MGMRNKEPYRLRVEVDVDEQLLKRAFRVQYSLVIDGKRVNLNGKPVSSSFLSDYQNPENVILDMKEYGIKRSEQEVCSDAQILINGERKQPWANKK